MPYSTHYPSSHHASQAELLKPCPSLKGSHSYDICVVGGGFMGISSALHLAKLGYKVTLVESKRIGWGASGRNGGQLGYGMTKSQVDLLEDYSPEDAKHFWNISVEAVELFHSLCGEHNISCDFKSGNMACAVTEEDYDGLIEHAEIVNSYGTEIYEILSKEDTISQTASPLYCGSTITQKAGHINPLKYVLGLAKAAQELGVDIYEESPVTEFHETTSKIKVNFENGTISADKLVLGCNGYIANLNKKLSKRVFPIENYQAATAPLKDTELEKVINNGACAWDTARSVHYFRLTPDNRLTMGCAIGFAGHTPRNLEQQCRKHLEFVYPDLKDIPLDYMWGGTLGGNHESLPDVGQLTDNIYFAQCFTGHGVGLAPLLGKYIADKIHTGSDNFDFLAKVPHKNIIGGKLLRIPATMVYKFATNTMDMITHYRRSKLR